MQTSETEGERWSERERATNLKPIYDFYNSFDWQPAFIPVTSFYPHSIRWLRMSSPQYSHAHTHAVVPMRCDSVSALSKFKNKNLRFNFSVVRSLRIFFLPLLLLVSFSHSSLASFGVHCGIHTARMLLFACMFDSEAHSNTCTFFCRTLTHRSGRKKETNTSAFTHTCTLAPNRCDRVSVRVCFIGFIENGFTSASTKLAGWSGFNPMHTYLIPIEMKRKKCLCTLFSRFLSFSLSCLGEIQKFHSFNLVIYVCCGIL